MQAELIKIGQVKPNPSNPRTIKDDKFKKLVKSIQEFPQMLSLRPIVVNDDMIVLGGNMRLKACKEAGLKEVPVIRAKDLTEEQQREFIIKDNVGFGEWDWEAIANEWNLEELTEWGLEVPEMGTGDELRDEYSAKIGEVIYEPKQTKHSPEDLFVRETRFDAEIEAIQNEGIREMLEARAAYFSTFNFGRIADYYAYQATPEEKSIMEKLALVLLDKDQLIENGFSDITEKVISENGFND